MSSSITGVVQDSSKAAITDAKLKLINTQTGTENDSTTNAQGMFLLPEIIPGSYTLQIESDGFATTQVKALNLNAGDAKNLRIRMKVGAVTETVSVDASGLTLNTTDATVSTTVDRNLISAVPLNGRSLQDLALLTPGIVTQSPQVASLSGSQTQGDFGVNGQGARANMFFVDGVSAKPSFELSAGNSSFANAGSIAGSTALGTTQSLISTDALQEFRVLTSTYSAEFGRTPGGQFTFQTRSGTIKPHGSLYEYFRGKPLDSGDWFAAAGRGEQPEYSQNDFGGSVGGPLVLWGDHHRPVSTFAFGSYEGLYLNQPVPPTVLYTPFLCSQGEYGCNPSPPNLPSPAIAAVLAGFPFAGQEINDASGNPSGMADAEVYQDLFPANVNATSIRVDHHFNPLASVFIRFGDTPSYARSRSFVSVTGSHLNSHTWSLGSTAAFSSSHSNEFTLGFIDFASNASTTPKQNFDDSDPPPAGNLGVAVGIPSALNVDPSLARIYTAASAEAYVHIAGVGDSDSFAGQITSSLRQWTLRDTFTLRTRNHAFRFGLDEQHLSSRLTPPPLSILADFFTYNSLANNAASDLVVAQSIPESPVRNEFSLFAEDAWKVSSRLNISAGLRWDVSPAPKGHNGQDAYKVTGTVGDPATLQLAPRGTPLWHTSLFNFAPRLGGAWRIKTEPGKELIFRGGAGVFFDTAMQPAFGAFQGLGFTSYVHSLNAPVPATSTQLNFSAAVRAPYTNATVFLLSPHLQLPYSWQWNIGLEQSLGKNQSITLSYVGADGHRLLVQQRTNVSSYNSNFGDIDSFPGGLTSSFQSLQLQTQRSLARGLEALASYTWAHSLDYGSTDPFYKPVRGNSSLDVRQNLEAALSWSQASEQHRFFSKKTLTRGFGLDGRLIARTGYPVNVLGNFNFDPITGRPYYSGVDLIPGRPLYLYDAGYPGGRNFNGGAYAVAPAVVLPYGMTAGNAPRNFLRGFPEVQTNVAGRQTYQLHDGLNLQFKIEAFNVFNHPTFGYIDPSFSDLLFGRSTKMLDQSFGNAGALYNQGGPRAVQLSLRATF